MVTWHDNDHATVIQLFCSNGALLQLVKIVFLTIAVIKKRKKFASLLI